MKKVFTIIGVVAAAAAVAVAGWRLMKVRNQRLHMGEGDFETPHPVS
jgi:hypothetical protein